MGGAGFAKLPTIHEVDERQYTPGPARPSSYSHTHSHNPISISDNHKRARNSNTSTTDPHDVPESTPKRACPNPPPVLRPGEPPHTPTRQRNYADITAPPAIQDRLGTFVRVLTTQFDDAESWETFVQDIRGDPQLSPDLEDLPHPAAPLLVEMRDDGVAVNLKGPDWTTGELQERLERGPHKSATEYAEFVRDEMADFVKKGYWVVLPFDKVKDLPNLRLSPLGAVPQRDRRPRLIVDLTYYGVNAETVSYTPKESMQFGHALERICWMVRHANPKYGKVFLSKFDLADGFYRMNLKAAQAPGLACVLPKYENEPQLVAIPLVGPMGWSESPPSFCAITETIADVANSRLRQNYAPPHRLESIIRDEGDAAARAVTAKLRAPNEGASTIVPSSDPSSDNFVPAPELPSSAPMCEIRHPPLVLPEVEPPPSHQTLQPREAPLSFTDIFVDDFIMGVQGNPRRRDMVRRILLNTIDDVLPAPGADQPFRNEPTSVKKLRKGDGSWETIKEVLGWIIDTENKTISLPPHKAARLLQLFEELRDKKRVSVKHWRKFLGELRSMVLAIPGGKGLFSALQLGLTHSDRNRVRITVHMRRFLDDFELLARSVAQRPTRLAEIVPDHPQVLGATDAAKPGMGGVIFVEGEAPMLWRVPFPKDIQDQIVSTDNPTGKITNSDLEQAGVLAQHDIICQLFDTREVTIATLCDNTPAVGRHRRGSTTTDECAAYLCRLGCLHQRHYRYCAEVSHINGIANAMSDDCSRLWQLDRSQLLSHFDQTYTQKSPWRSVQLRSKMRTAIISALRKRPFEIASLLGESSPKTQRGLSGKPIAKTWAPTPYYQTDRTPCLSYKSLLSATARENSQRIKAKTPSDLAQWRMPSVPSGRRSPAWGYLTHDSFQAESSSLDSVTKSKLTSAKTPHLNASSLSPSSSSKQFWNWHKRPPVSPCIGNDTSQTSSSWASSSYRAQANTYHLHPQPAANPSVCVM